MLPGESPVAFFLRTQASKETKEIAKEAQAKEAERKDKFWQGASDGDKKPSRVDFILPGVCVVQVEGKGRGLVAKEPISAGTVILRECALSAVPQQASSDGDDEHILAAARLASAVLVAGTESASRSLEPRPGKEFAEHDVRVARAKELMSGRLLVRKICPKSSAIVNDECLERLLLAIMLNVLDVTLPDGQVHRGLFSEMGSMVNHSCRPNLIVHGLGVKGKDTEYDRLQLVLQTARDIAAGEELTISYLGGLYLPFPERDEQLRETYGFGAEQLPTDKGLEALSPNVAAISAAEREQAQQRVIASNSAACAAWERAAALQASGSASEQSNDLKRLQMVAAQNYAALLNTNFLAETHSWRYNATWRLATLLAKDGPPKACAQALMLWESAMRSGKRVWPSENWPEHRKLLRGAQQAAVGAGDTTKGEEYARQLEEIEVRMALQDPVETLAT